MIRFFKRSPQIVGSGHFFHIDHLKHDLKTRTIRSGAITISAQALKFVISMGSTVVLARLLTPEDFGLIGMVTVIIGFVELLKDLGLAEATIQQEQINQRQISTLFWINLAISCGVALTVALLSPLIAWFYHEPRLITITLVLAITFIFSGLTVQHQALLRRQMHFAMLAKIEMAALVAGVATAQLSAFYGAAYWSLVYMQLAFSLTYVVGIWAACSWRPGLPGWNSEIRSMLKFGGNLTGFRCFNYLSRNFDNFIIGRVWGPG
ncbi:MAG: lipopolysaccharide biosynthesis protein, partial [Leptolyngbyaceae cyanobacterium]